MYLGDSATLSFLQSIRRLVENKSGPSPFTTDPSRNRVLEATIMNSASVKHNYALPDQETAQLLIDSFFANVCFHVSSWDPIPIELRFVQTAGLFHIFDKELFENRTAETFEHPLDADPKWLCQLNLVFAVGLQMRKDSPIRNAKASKILERLESSGVARAEIFYLAARQLSDPTMDFEDGGIVVVQSLLLMAIYLLASAKRNAAWGYMGKLRRAD